jgi:hypothetical protein
LKSQQYLEGVEWSDAFNTLVHSQKNEEKSEGYTHFQIFGGDTAIPLVAGLERGGSFSFVALLWGKYRKSVHLPTFV